MVIYLPGQSADEEPILDELTPREIVRELDKHVVGQAEAKRAGVKVTIILDVVHVLEYLWLAARALFGGSTPEAETWVGQRLFGLLTGRSGGDTARTIFLCQWHR